MLKDFRKNSELYLRSWLKYEYVQVYEGNNYWVTLIFSSYRAIAVIIIACRLYYLKGAEFFAICRLVDTDLICLLFLFIFGCMTISVIVSIQ